MELNDILSMPVGELHQIENGYHILLEKLPDSSIFKGRRVSKGKPFGWHSKKIRGTKGEYFYHRTHIVAFRFIGRRATLIPDKEEFFTGTRFLNVNPDDRMKSMAGYEDRIVEYLSCPDVGKVYYKATLAYKIPHKVPVGINLHATVIDNSDRKIEQYGFDVCIRNIYPDYEIDYSTGRMKKIER